MHTEATAHTRAKQRWWLRSMLRSVGFRSLGGIPVGGSGWTGKLFRRFSGGIFIVSQGIGTGAIVLRNGNAHSHSVTNPLCR